MKEPEVYLGDGAYARFNGFELIVYTTDGLSRQNEVVMEADACAVLLRFMAECGITKEIR